MGWRINDGGWVLEVREVGLFGVIFIFVFVFGIGIKQKNPLSSDKGFFKNKIKTGGGLLSRFRSTIGAGGLNFCVRNGNR